MGTFEPGRWQVGASPRRRLIEGAEKGFTPVPDRLGWNHENWNGHDGYGHSGGPGLGDILRFPKEEITIIVFSNYADMYPYLAASIAKLFFPEIKLPEIQKTLDRGYEKLL